MIWASLEPLLYRVFRFNPAVALLELRTRLRGQRAFGMLFFFAFIGAFSLVTAFMVMDVPRGMGGGPSQPGASVLMALMMVQLTLVLLIMPAYGASSIAAERERQTLELVEATLLSATDIVSGKLLSVGAFALMLLTANLPVATWCLMLGGMNLRQLFYSYTYLFAFALAILSLGMLISALSRRTMTAVVVGYGLIIALYAGFPVASAVLIGVVSGHTHGSVTLGLMGSLVLLLIAGAVAASLVYLTLRSVARRHRALRRSVAGIAVPAVVAVALGAVLVLGASGVVGSTSSFGVQALYALHPYVVMATLAHPDVANAVIASSHRLLNPDTSVWLVNTALCLCLGIIMWFLAISAFRWTAQRS